jgi:peroxiredoxin
VCAHQLVRLEQRRAGLERCGAQFLVLAPGPVERIRAARKATGFRAVWVADSSLSVGRALDLVLGAGELVPAILEIDAEGRVTWEQRGRSGEFYGDGALQKHLECEQRDT